jgi:hypothetical protein
MTKTSFARSTAVVVASALVLLESVSATAAPQNLIQNGSFESPAQKGPGTYTGVVPTGWTYNNAGNNNIAIINGDVMKTPGPQDGSQFLFLADLGGITENIDVPKAGTYSLGLFAAVQSRATAGSLAVFITNAGDKFIAEQVTSKDWSPYGMQVSLAAGANQIYIKEGSPFQRIYVDDVSLFALPDDLSTFFTGGLAFGLCAGLSLRIKSRSQGGSRKDSD